MIEIIRQYLCCSEYFVLVLSVAYYFLGVRLHKKTKLAVFSPLLVASALSILTIVVLDIDMEVYDRAGSHISFFLTAATVCYGILLYEQLRILKDHFKAIMIGIVSGVAVTLVMILGLSMLLRIPHDQYVTLLPKAVTTAIGLGIAEENGGYPSITIVWILMTGNLGNTIAEPVIRAFHIEEPVARGVAIGSSSHAIGTAKAMQIGETEGAISGLSLAVTGLISVVACAIFAQFY